MTQSVAAAWHRGAQPIAGRARRRTQPGPWSLDGAAAVGRMLRDLHQATSSFRPPPDAVWFPWPGVPAPQPG